MQRDLIKCDILWKGNPISVVKAFGKLTCDLCNREGMEIIKLSRSSPILSSTPAQRYMACVVTNPGSIGAQDTPNADERQKGEKVVLEAPNLIRRLVNLIETDGNESVGSHSHQQGTEPCGFISI
jgi:hypothetical protein